MLELAADASHTACAIIRVCGAGLYPSEQLASPATSTIFDCLITAVLETVLGAKRRLATAREVGAAAGGASQADAKRAAPTRADYGERARVQGQRQVA